MSLLLSGPILSSGTVGVFSITDAGDGTPVITYTESDDIRIQISGGTYDGLDQTFTPADLAAGPVNLLAPVLAGTGEAGQTLTIQRGFWVYDAGNPAPVITYTTNGTNSVDVTDPENPTLLVDAADAGATLTVTERATQSGTGFREATSNGIAIASDALAVPAAFDIEILPSLTSTYQDTAGDTPVTTGGQDVRRVEAETGRFAFIEDTAFPVYAQPLVMDDVHLLYNRNVGAHVTDGYVSLPTSSVRPSSPNGFTITGVDRFSDGRWLCSQFGKALIGDSTIRSSLVILSSDKTTINSEIDLFALYATEFYIHGCAIDTTDGSYWFCDTINNIIRHVSSAGAAITDDQISVGANILGLAYRPSTDRLYVSLANGVIRIYDPNTQTLDDTITLSPAAGPNHISIRDDFLFQTGGVNGVSGNIWMHRVSDGVQIAAWEDITSANCLKGIWVEPNGSDITAHIGHNGIYRASVGDAADPVDNIITQITLTPPAVEEVVTVPKLQLIMVLQESGLPTTTETLVGWQDVQPSGEHGWGLQFRSDAGGNIRLAAKNAGDGAAPGRKMNWNANAAGLFDGGPHILRVDWPYGSNPLCWIDGAPMTGTVTNDFSTLTGGLFVDEIAIGAAHGVAGAWAVDSDYDLYRMRVHSSLTEAQIVAYEDTIAAAHGVTLKRYEDLFDQVSGTVLSGEAEYTQLIQSNSRVIETDGAGNARLAAGGAAGGELIIRNTPTLANDQAVEVTLTDLGDSNTAVYLICRATDADNFVLLRVKLTETIWFGQNVAATRNNFVTDTTHTPVNGETLRFEVQGTTARLLVNGTQIWSATESVLSTITTGSTGVQIDQALAAASGTIGRIRGENIY